MAKKRFDIHEWQANQVKKRLAEQKDDRPDNWRELQGYNPDHFYKDFDKVKKAAQDSSPGITKIKLPMSDIEDEVTIHQKNPSCYDTSDKCLDDVTISWGDETHTISFEYDDTIDKMEDEQVGTYEFVTSSPNGQWQFILEVQGHYNLDLGWRCNPCIQDYSWEQDLIIQPHPSLDGDDDDLRLEPELDEQNSLGGAGSGNSFTAGDGMDYATPKAFKKKNEISKGDLKYSKILAKVKGGSK